MTSLPAMAEWFLEKSVGVGLNTSATWCSVKHFEQSTGMDTVLH